jgi:hypothetical protein
MPAVVSFEHLRRFPGRDDLSAIEHDDVVGNGAHFGRIVAHVDPRHAEFVVAGLLSVSVCFIGGNSGARCKRRLGGKREA